MENSNSNSDENLSEEAYEKKHSDIENVDLHIDKDVSGNDIMEEGRESRTHGQQHGNRHYKSYSNHSSAGDQPRVDTGA